MYIRVYMYTCVRVYVCGYTYFIDSQNEQESAADVVDDMLSNLCVSICIHTCIRVCQYTCILVYMYTCVYAFAHMCSMCTQVYT